MVCGATGCWLPLIIAVTLPRVCILPLPVGLRGIDCYYLLVTVWLLPSAFCCLCFLFAAFAGCLFAFCCLPSDLCLCLLPSAFYAVSLCLMPSAFCLRPSAVCDLPSAFCLLLHDVCLLPSAFCRLPDDFYLRLVVYCLCLLPSTGCLLCAECCLSLYADCRKFGCL